MDNLQVKEKEISLKVKHLKKIEDFETVFNGSYLYCIKGKNKIGKTTLMEALIMLMTATNVTPEIITRGHKKTIVEGCIPGPKGMYTIQMTVTPKTTSFVAITPDDIKISKVSEIRDIFKYNSMTVLDFINKSYTAAGRREQIKIISDLLPAKDKEAYLHNLKLLDPKQSALLDKRKEANKNAEKNKILLENAALGIEDYIKDETFIDEEIELSKIALEAAQKKKDALPELSKDEILTKIENYKEKTNQTRANLEQTISDNNDEIKAAEARIAKLKEANDKIEKELIRVNNEFIIKNKKAQDYYDNFDEDMYLEIENDYNEVKKKHDDLLIIKSKTDSYFKTKSLYEDSLIIQKRAAKAIEDVKTANTLILENSDLKSLNIEIIDDVLHVNGFVFNEHQVADSELVLTTTSILAKTLKNSQLLCVGKLAELDKNSRQKLYEIGKENNIAIIGDDVDDEYENLFVKTYEEVELDTKIIKETPTSIKKENIQNEPESEKELPGKFNDLWNPNEI